MATETKIENALITGTTLGREDHGIMSAYIHLSGDGWGVSFGGFAFEGWNEAAQKREASAFGMQFVMNVIDVVGVDSWEKLKGQHVRVESKGWGGRALRIGHITKNQWFDPAELADVMRAAERRKGAK